MNWLRQLSTIAAGAMLLACDAPTRPDQITAGSPALDIAVSAERACHPVTFETASWLAGAGSPFFVEGVMSGDIEGTFGVRIDFGEIRQVGRTFHLTGTIEWTVTGGVLPGPFPLVFTTEYTQVNVLHFEESLLVWAQNLAVNRATSGVRKANLEMKGDFYNTEIAHHTFRGVICP